MMKKLTKEQGIILTGYTGKLMCRYGDFHEDVEKRMGRPVMSHEIGFLQERISHLYTEDFLKIVGDISYKNRRTSNG